MNLIVDIFEDVPICFKDPELFVQFHKLKDKNMLMYHLAVELADYSYTWFDKQAIVTSVYRGPTNELYNPMSVHGFWRGVDFRSSIYIDDELAELEGFVNGNYVYDPKRPEKQCFMVHGDPPHIHVQVHPSTTFA